MPGLVLRRTDARSRFVIAFEVCVRLQQGVTLYVALAVLELAVLLLSFLSAGITDICHHTQPCNCFCIMFLFTLYR